MVGEFVSLGVDPLDDGGVLGGALADDKEGGLDAALFEDVEEAGGVFLVRAVVEGEGDVGAVDMALAEGDFGLGAGGGGGAR